MKDFKLVLKNTKFIYLWSSQILSQLTINIMNFLLLIRIFEYTQSSIATSFLWIAYALPAIIIGPIAAASVDMLDRRRVLMVTNFLQSATILLYAFVHESRLFLPYGVASMYSFLNQFYVPAESASLPSVVRKPSLPQANGLFFLTQQAALIIGFGFAGLLNHVLGFENSLFLCSGLLFLAFIVVSFLPRMRTRHSVPKSLDRAVFKFFKRIMEGYSFIRENHSILLPFILMMGLSVALSIVVVSLPVMAEEIFRIDINSAGVIVIVPAGIGAAFGTLTITRLLKRGWRKKRAIELFFTIIAAVLLVFTFLLPELPSTARLATGIIGVFLLGLSFVGIFIPSQTFLQEKTPGGLRGRVFGNYWFLATVVTVLPVLFSGAITEIFGIRLLTFLLTGLSVAALVISRRFGEDVLREGFDVFKNDK